MSIAYFQDLGDIIETHEPHVRTQTEDVQDVRADGLWDDEYHSYCHNPVIGTPVASEHR